MAFNLVSGSDNKDALSFVILSPAKDLRLEKIRSLVPQDEKP